MFNSITSAISSFFKPKETSATKPSISPFNNAPTTSVNPFVAPKVPSVSPMQMNKGLSTIASTPSASFSINKPASTAIQNQVLSSPVTVAKLTNPPAPLPTTSTSPTPMLGTSTGVSSTTTTPTTTPTTPSTGREDVMSRLLKLTEKQGTSADVQASLEKEYELQAKQEKLNTLNARAMTVDRDYETKRRAIMENPEGKLTGALAGEIKNLERERDQQLADIGIQQAVAQGNVNLAESTIKRKVEAEFEPIKNQIESLKTYMTLYSNDLTDKEKATLESQLRIQEQNLKSGSTSALNAQQAQYYAQGIKEGSIQMSEIPQDVRGAVLGYMQQTGMVDQKEVAKVDKAKNTLNSIAGVLGDVSAGTTAVGSGLQRLLGRGAGFIGLGSFEEKNAKINQLKALLTFDNLSQLKGLGAMSDREFATIQASAGAINPNMSEQAFTTELKRISDTLTNSLLKSHATPIEEKAQILTDKAISEYPQATPEQIKQIVNGALPSYTGSSFNSAGNAKASTLRDAIVSQESGGSYTAINKDSGALGKYQIMPSNLKNLVGLSDTPENRKKFLNSPELQDQAFDNLLAELDKTYKGDVKKVLGAYYGGAFGARVVGTPAGDKPQGKYPSINQYVSQILNRTNTA